MVSKELATFSDDNSDIMRSLLLDEICLPYVGVRRYSFKFSSPQDATVPNMSIDPH